MRIAFALPSVLAASTGCFEGWRGERDLQFPCVLQMKRCNEDEACRNCYDPFTPSFDLSSLDSCEDMDAAFERSYSPTCAVNDTSVQRLRLCLENDFFYVLTLGTVKEMCSGPETLTHA